MSRIGLVDDREKSRESYKLLLEFPLISSDNKDWEIIDIEPFNSLEDYVSWILEDEISVLIIDEKLNEAKFGSKLGHEVVEYLRERFKDLPIYGVTAFEREKDLNTSYKNYNLIISKSDLESKRDEYVNLFLKTGEDFFKNYQLKIRELSLLSEKIASGNYDSKDVDKVNTLQTYLSIPNTSAELYSKQEWLNELKVKLDSFDQLLKRIDNELGANN